MLADVAVFWEHDSKEVGVSMLDAVLSPQPINGQCHTSHTISFHAADSDTCVQRSTSVHYSNSCKRGQRMPRRLRTWQHMCMSAAACMRTCRCAICVQGWAESVQAHLRIHVDSVFCVCRCCWQKRQVLQQRTVLQKCSTWRKCRQCDSLQALNCLRRVCLRQHTSIFDSRACTQPA
jgi:hypothetical protein